MERDALTCLHLEMIIWAYTRPGLYDLDGGVRRRYAHRLENDGMLTIEQPPKKERKFGRCQVYLRITDKGRAWLEHVLATPLPKEQTRWVFE